MINTQIIELLMQQNRLSLSQLSLKTGLPKSTLSRILNRETIKPSQDTIRAIANYFSIPISELLLDEEINLKVSLKQDTLINNLRALMLNASILSAKDLSRATGIPASNIERILNGTTNSPHLSTLNELANYFDVTISQLKGDEPLDEIFKGQINPSFSKVPILILNDVTGWLEDKVLKEASYKFINASRKIMGQKSFAILINNEDYLTDFKKNYILIVDSDLDPDNGDYIIASINKAPPSIYEFFNVDKMVLREAGEEEYIILDSNHSVIYGVVVEIKLKENIV